MLATADRFQWAVTYTDGTRIQQRESDGKRNSYEDIDRDKLATFEMWEVGVRVLFMRFKKGERLIWRRRVEKSPNGIEEVCHIIGKQQTINGKNIQGIILLFESDGRIEAAGRFEENHPWLYPPQKVRGEEDWR